MLFASNWHDESDVLRKIVCSVAGAFPVRSFTPKLVSISFLLQDFEELVKMD